MTVGELKTKTSTKSYGPVQFENLSRHLNIDYLMSDTMEGLLKQYRQIRLPCEILNIFQQIDGNFVMVINPTVKIKKINKIKEI